MGKPFAVAGGVAAVTVLVSIIAILLAIGQGYRNSIERMVQEQSTRAPAAQP